MNLTEKITSPEFKYRVSSVSLLIIITGMLLSRAMMSIGMIGIVLMFFCTTDIKASFKAFYTDKILLALSGVFFLYLLTGFYSEDKTYFTQRLTIKLPFLLLPLGFSSIKDIPKKYVQIVLYYFLILISIVSLLSFINYLFNYAEINYMYRAAKVIPNIFDINHIRYSLMIATSIIIAYYLYKEKFYLFSSQEKFLIGFCGIFLLAFLHILSVRSGLLALYSVVLFYIAYTIIKERKYLQGAILLGIIVAAPIILYFSLPTFKAKILYTIDDVGRFMNGNQGANANDYSDSNRLLSLKIALDVTKNDPVLGLGVGDVYNAMLNHYETYYPVVTKERRLIPHNQYIYIYAASGLVGVAIFIFLSLYPFFNRMTRENILFLSVNVIFISSYLSEATLENQLGVCLFSVMFLTTYKLSVKCKV